MNAIERLVKEGYVVEVWESGDPGTAADKYVCALAGPTTEGRGYGRTLKKAVAEAEKHAKEDK